MLLQALKLLLSCKTVGREEALELGLCDEPLEGESPLREAEEHLAQLVGRLAPAVARAAKEVAANGAKRGASSLEERLRGERDIFSRVWAGKAHVEAMEKNIKH